MQDPTYHVEFQSSRSLEWLEHAKKMDTFDEAKEYVEFMEVDNPPFMLVNWRIVKTSQRVIDTQAHQKAGNLKLGNV